MTPVPASGDHDGDQAARVGEHNAVVWKRVITAGLRRKLSNLAMAHSLPKSAELANAHIIEELAGRSGAPGGGRTSLRKGRGSES